MRFVLSVILAVLAVLHTPSLLFAKDAANDVFTLVIDPGHGGKDLGCRGKTSKEKDIVLKVGTLLGDKIQKKYGDKVKIVYTRDKDKYLTLQDRAQIANKAHGDLFISIHVNSVDKKNRNRTRLSGAQVYICGLHKSDNNLAVAMRENSVMELDPDYSEIYQGFDPNSSESYIIFELSQNKH